MPNKTRILIVVFDALRPEFVIPDLMPNLHRFARDGVRYINARSTYPSETRVNQSAVTTGCYPRRHGVVANNFVFGEGAQRRVVRTGDDIAFEEALGAMSEPLFGVPTLGERLDRAGLSYATISAGTSGGGRLINLAADQTGAFRFAMRRPEAAVPQDAYEALKDAVGPLPDYELPALDWVRYAVDGYLGYVEPRLEPDVMLLWLCEPDESYHFKGIGSPESLETIKNADAQFGRILAHHDAAIDQGELQVIAMSDHGQISLEGEALDIGGMLQEAGLGDDIEMAISNAGGLWFADADTARIEKTVTWLLGQDWCGPVFTRDGAGGTLTLDSLFVGHDRAPDIALILANDDRANGNGISGLSRHASIYPPGGGSHGGLSRYEMNNVIIFGGSRFKSECEIDVPAGNVDILPTVFALLGHPVEEPIDGRVLLEGLADGPDPADITVDTRELVASNETGPKTHLSISEIQGTPYINRAWTA